MKQKFLITKALAFGWQTIVDHIAFMASVFLTYIGSIVAAYSVIGILLSFWLLPSINRPLSSSWINSTEYMQAWVTYARTYVGTLSAPQILLVIVCASALIAFFYLLELGMIQIALNLYDYNASSLKKLFSCKHLIIRAIIAHFLYAFISVLGLAFFVIPGIYFSLLFKFYEQILVDKNVGVLESFRISAALTKGSLMLILGLSCVLWILQSVVGLLGGTIGFVVMIPFTLLAQTYAYRKLQTKPRADHPDTLHHGPY